MLAISIFVWWDLATTYIKEWNLFWAKFGHITYFCQLDNNKNDYMQKFEGAGAYRFAFSRCWEPLSII